MFETNAKGESEFWRVALFRCLEKAKTLPVLPETVFALLLLFLLNRFVLFFVCSFLHKGLRIGNTEFRPTFFRSVAPIKVGRNRLILANFLKP